MPILPDYEMFPSYLRETRPLPGPSQIEFSGRLSVIQVGLPSRHIVLLEVLDVVLVDDRSRHVHVLRDRNDTGSSIVRGNGDVLESAVVPVFEQQDCEVLLRRSQVDQRRIDVALLNVVEGCGLSVMHTTL